MPTFKELVGIFYDQFVCFPYAFHIIEYITYLRLDSPFGIGMAPRKLQYYATACTVPCSLSRVRLSLPLPRCRAQRERCKGGGTLTPHDAAKLEYKLWNGKRPAPLNLPI